MRGLIHMLALLALGLVLTTPARAEPLAATPPMGWNSWDAYGFTIDEAQFRANASVLASMHNEGWTYAVIDEGWYMANPSGAHLADRQYQLNAYGLLVPSTNRFPTAAQDAGFKALADWLHSQHLKFGLHIVRGIPRDAVAHNLPIEGSAFHAADAADTSDTCPWDDGNYGVRDDAAGQAYYDSMMRLYAAWGVDFVKVDCIADHPYKASEIRQIAQAIRNSGRPIVLSLSPGPTQLAHADEVVAQSQMWRIADDIWDGWSFPPPWPNGLQSAFDNLAAWRQYAGPGHWPDADMLPFGSLRPHPGWGDARESGLTHDEQRTEFTLWAMARSPLILGANLTMLDDYTRSLITNRDVIAIDQAAWESHPVTDLPSGFGKARVWVAQAGSQQAPTRYVAFFNLDDQPATLTATWADLGVSGRHVARELWSGVRLRRSASVTVNLLAHGSVVYRLQ